jgi:hypothetical protein
MEHLETAATVELARELMTGNYDPLVAAAAQATHKRLAGKVP